MSRCFICATVLIAVVGFEFGRASAADPPRMLMLTQSAGFVHGPVKRAGAPLSGAEIAMTLLGRQSGEFSVDCSQDAASAITKENLQNYDIVTFYTSGDLPIAEEDVNYFLSEWVQQAGHGFMGFHSSTDTYNQHEPYSDFVGGTFDGHPWGQNTPISVTVLDTAHPAMKPFGGEFDYREEIYQYRNWQPEKVHVLMSLNMAKTETKRPYHVPIAWCKQVGNGRMFYNNLGHREDTWQDERFLKSIVGAVRWISGKEDGSALPNPEVSLQQHQQSIVESAKVGITPESIAAAEKARQAATAAKQAAAETKPSVEVAVKAAEEAVEEAAKKKLAALTWTDPARAAAEDQDFSFQGEYGLNLREAHWGVQVVALGGGTFDAYLLEGGLPGLGWTRNNSRVRLSGTRTNDRVRFTTDDNKLTAIIQDRMISVSEGKKLLARLPRLERQSPTLGAKPPADAIVLFDGSSVDAWIDGVMQDGLLLNTDVSTKQLFNNYTLHLEFRTPYKPYARGQQRGNSGVYHQGRFETQVLDSFGLEGLMNETGGIYTIAAPTLNMCLPPLTWQTYDVDFVSARFDADGTLTSQAKITVMLNGVVVQQDQELPKTTTAAPVKTITPEPGPLFLQHHNNPIYYRNIWIEAQ